MGGKTKRNTEKARKRKATDKPVEPSTTEAIRQITLALIDRVPGSQIPPILLSLSLLVVAYRMPEQALATVPDVVIRLLAERGVVMSLMATATTALFGTCLLLLGVIWGGRKIYASEINRLASTVRALEEAIDRDRPTSILPSGTPKELTPGSQPGDST